MGNKYMKIQETAIKPTLSKLRISFLSRLLRNMGVHSVVLDLLQHSFEKARDLYADVWLGFPEAELSRLLGVVGFQGVTTALVDREPEPPHFQTLLAIARKG